MFYITRVSYCLESQWAHEVMMAWHGRQRMDRGELEAADQGAMGAGCACGTRRATLNPGGQGVLRGEASRLDAWVLRQGGCASGARIKISISTRGQAAQMSCPDVRALA
jgi:hypothetical protein